MTNLGRSTIISFPPSTNPCAIPIPMPLSIGLPACWRRGDPLYIARRVVRFASEDVGIADSRALEVAVAAYEACHFIGMPECSVNLAHAVIYMAMSPKSNAMELAYIEAREDALHHLQEPVPLVIRNAPTALMKEAGYGKGYIYAHDTKEKIVAMDCLPDSLKGRRYYHPTEEGFEVRYKGASGKDPSMEGGPAVQITI